MPARRIRRWAVWSARQPPESWVVTSSKGRRIRGRALECLTDSRGREGLQGGHDSRSQITGGDAPARCRSAAACVKLLRFDTKSPARLASGALLCDESQRGVRRIRTGYTTAGIDYVGGN